MCFVPAKVKPLEDNTKYRALGLVPAGSADWQAPYSPPARSALLSEFTRHPKPKVSAVPLSREASTSRYSES